MASLIHVGVLAAALCGMQFVSAAEATHGHHHAGDLVQQRLLQTGCLLGPFTLDAYPTCVTEASDGDAASWDPWTHRPYCVGSTNYCVFTNADFQGPKRGVSIIDMRPPRTGNATSAVTSVAQLLLSAIPSPELAHEDSPPYEMRDIPGKGKGLVATRKISRGQVFMIEHAAVVADSQFPSRITREQGRQLLTEAVERLPGAAEVLNLARSSPSPDTVPLVEDVMRTNSFTVEIGGKEYMALFPKIARMNHACKPSAITRFNATTLSNTVFAFHDILPNEELTISYSPFGLPSDARHATLRLKWGFDCTCDLCTSPPSVLAASDTRRNRVSQLGKEVVTLIGRGEKEDMKKAVGLYTEVVEAVEEEGLVPHLGNHYEVLGQLWAAAGDRKKAVEWVKRGKIEEERFGKGLFTW